MCVHAHLHRDDRFHEVAFHSSRYIEVKVVGFAHILDDAPWRTAGGSTNMIKMPSGVVAPAPLTRERCAKLTAESGMARQPPQIGEQSLLVEVP